MNIERRCSIVEEAEEDAEGAEEDDEEEGDQCRLAANPREAGLAGLGGSGQPEAAGPRHQKAAQPGEAPTCYERVDSQSILTNKHKLKQFWESRMELELAAADERHHQAPKKRPARLEDENNNNRSSNSQTTPDNGRVEPLEEPQLMSLDPSLCHSSVHTGSGPPGHECEEQTAQEEFSSTSSSFGPMSISNPSRSDDDELNSTQSGSVLTVIRADNDKCDSQTTTPEPITDAAANDPLPANGLVVSERASRDHEEEEEEEEEDSDEDDDEQANIGVAFESLHFDTEVKSSRHERVEPPALATQPEVARPANRSLPADVKSVCNLITAAISDATRQVDKLLVSGRANQQPVASLEHATFVREPLDQDDDDDDDDQAQGASNSSVEEAEHEQLADLSSIFEANVRREIQRFESNSVARKSRGSANNNNTLVVNNVNFSPNINTHNGLTGRRIAEEIRSFNEREMELKQRYQDNKAKARAPAAEPQSNRAPACELETIVRSGKTLRIPKAQSCLESAAKLQQLKCYSPPIKLSSSSPKGSQATISMHKFIASGGRRFVLTSSLANNNSAPNKVADNGSAPTSGSVHCGSGGCNGSGGKPIKATRVADWKAVDSLACKETPVVQPGLTRMVIETFSRMSDEARAPTSGPTDGAQRRTPARLAKSWGAGGWPLKRQLGMREAQPPIS